MRDSNYALRKAYFEALTGITFDGKAVPVYYLNIPDDIKANNYIVFGGVTNNDLSTKSSSEQYSTMRVTIHTISPKSNSGEAADNIAGQVYTRLYPDVHFKLDLSAYNLQCYSVEMVNDMIQDYGIVNSTVFIDRIILFRHRIFHR